MAGRQKSVAMDMRSLIGTLTPNQVQAFGTDFNRFLKCRPHPAKHDSLLNIIRRGEAAGRAGNELLRAFFHGAASALYGLSRLAEAKELEETLRPRLEAADAAAGCGANMTTSEKEDEMADTTREFSLQDLAAYLKADGIDYVLNEEHQCVTANLAFKESGSVQFFGRIDEDKRLMVLLYRFPVPAPANKRAIMTDAIARANFGLALGCFDMHRDSGTVLFRVGIPTDASLVSFSQYQHCMGVSLAAIGHFLPVFMRVLFGDADLNEMMPSPDS